MAKKPITKKAPIEKPELLKNFNELADVQFSSLYSLPQSFVRQNSKFINSVVSITQSALARNDNSIASSTPQMLVDTVQAAVNDRKRQSFKNNDTPQVLTDIKGLTDNSKDMDLFRELFPIATPMFELFYEYEMVYDMIPEASKCFDILRDAILSSDNFTKDFLIPRYDDFKIDSETSGINSSAQVHVNLIKDIIEEYELNSLFSDYIEDAMLYGAKPVMIVPIDHNFRESAKRILKTESADEIRNIIRDEYRDGAQVQMESYLDGFTTESGEEELRLEDANGFTNEMNECVDGLLELYENALEYEAAQVNTHNMTADEMKAFDVACESKRSAIKYSKDKKNRKKVIMEMLKVVDEMVNTKVKFTYGTDAIVMRDTSKICNQLKTMRRVKSRKSGASRNSNEVAMESIYESDPIALENDVDAICAIASSSKYKKVHHSITHESKVEEYDSWVLDFDDSVDFEDSITLEDSHGGSETEKRKPTGSVIVPLMPDTVVPISVHGRHIGYYIIERTGSDDLGSGVAPLLGYRKGGASSGFGIGAANLYGGNVTGSNGAGTIIRDMVDIPMYVKDDARRIELLRTLLSRAISERVHNPDIVNDKAFNSIIYSLIKDDYITHREVKITYVPVQSMVYFAHEIDKDTGVGVSVMQKGLFFAHVYIASLITNLMIAIAKSADREQINVEVGMGNRLEATVQKVMRSMQAKRASIDSIGNVDTIMRSLGTFQKSISLRHNGNPLIELETIPGQQVDMDNSLMEKSLKSFVNSFYVPHSAVNFLDDTEYARSISLQNALFMSRVVTLQAKYQVECSKFARILIRNKYPEKILTRKNVEKIKSGLKHNDLSKSAGISSAQDLIDLKNVFLDLPSPEGLNISSLNDQVSNVSTFADTFTEMLVPTELAMDSEKSDYVDQFKNKLKIGMFKKYLPGLPWDEFDTMVDTAKTLITQASIKMMKPEETPETPDGDGDGGGFGNF